MGGIDARRASKGGVPEDYPYRDTLTHKQTCILVPISFPALACKEAQQQVLVSNIKPNVRAWQHVKDEERRHTHTHKPSTPQRLNRKCRANVKKQTPTTIAFFLLVLEFLLFFHHPLKH